VAAENKLICHFLYLQLGGERLSAFHISIQADPAPSWVSPDSQQVPFHTTRGERIIVIKFSTLNNDVVRDVVHVAPLSLTRKHVKRCTLLGSRTLPRVRWAEWGPDTYMTGKLPFSRRWVCYVFGSCFVSLRWRRVKGGAIMSVFNLWDFNQLAYR
jgi:hypothetical protein